MTFNYYLANIKSIKPLGTITLDRFIQVIKNPKPQTKEIFEKINIAHKNNDITLKHELKSKLYNFTPCVLIDKIRNYENILNFSGLLILDFDKLEENYCIEFKEYLFNTYPFIICSWISASRHGVRAFVKIPICTSIDEFKQYYNAIERQFSQYNGFDRAVKNCVLPLFLSYDENILYRDNYTTWTKKYIPVTAPPVKQYIINDKSNLIEVITKSALDKITDAGHPILRATSYALGGYVGANYIDKSEAINLINNLIDCNGYLSKKASTYKKTALQMIEKGIQTPLYLKNE